MLPATAARHERREMDITVVYLLRRSLTDAQKPYIPQSPSKESGYRLRDEEFLSQNVAQAIDASLLSDVPDNGILDLSKVQSGDFLILPNRYPPKYPRSALHRRAQARCAECPDPAGSYSSGSPHIPSGWAR